MNACTSRENRSMNWRKLKRLRQSRLEIVEKLKEAQTGPVLLLNHVIRSCRATQSLWLTLLDHKADRVQIKGHATRRESIPDFMSNLSQSGYFPTVDLELIEVDENAARFSLVCTLPGRIPYGVSRMAFRAFRLENLAGSAQAARLRGADRRPGGCLLRFLLARTSRRPREPANRNNSAGIGHGSGKNLESQLSRFESELARLDQRLEILRGILPPRKETADRRPLHSANGRREQSQNHQVHSPTGRAQTFLLRLAHHPGGGRKLPRTASLLRKGQSAHPHRPRGQPDGQRNQRVERSLTHVVGNLYHHYLRVQGGRIPDPQ